MSYKLKSGSISLSVLILTAFFIFHSIAQAEGSAWLLVDNFENGMVGWVKKDTKNDTEPKIENPQITEVRSETGLGNHYLIKKPAADGIIGNRKALTFKALPKEVAVGETYTFFTRFQVEYFPNNHIFGISNLDAIGIEQHDYNAFEPSIRITDKMESNGDKNDGTLMVKKGKGYDKIYSNLPTKPAQPLEAGVWYSLWYVVNNASLKDGGQTYDLYLEGGEFKTQTLVYSGADFRMKREQPLTHFLMNCNTGPKKQPYGNGGVLYDDIYMAAGVILDSPLR